jgi:hypothetical protein
MNALRDRVPDLALHDFDEIGVPPGADTAWRHRASEQWVERALRYQAEGGDMLLAGQTPIGEILAAPSATCLDAISSCLLDCTDHARIARLRARGPEWLTQVGGDLQAYLNWAAWMRMHAVDPSWRLDVIRADATEGEMAWERWSDWEEGDPRWRVLVIDTSGTTVDQVANALADWIAGERALLRSSTHPLADWAA